MLTDGQCDGYRRMFVSFNDMLRVVHEAGKKEALKEMGWQPIETAPKQENMPILLGQLKNEDHDGVSTLGWWQHEVEDGSDYMGGDAGFVDHAFQIFNPGRSFGNKSYQYSGNQPTHWKPLPAAPKDEVSE